MIIIKGKNGKSIALENYINHNVKKGKKIVILDNVKAFHLQYGIKRNCQHLLFSHSFEELIEDLDNEIHLKGLDDVDVIVFECNISTEQLEKFDESKYSQEIIITVQSDEYVKVCDTKNIGNGLR